MLFKIVGLNKILKKNKVRHASLNDRKKVNALAVASLDRWIQKNFEGEGDLAVKGWQPLAPSTLLARAKGWGDYIADPNPRILQNKGSLKQNWKHYYDKRRGWIRAKEPYAIYHQKGGKYLPARPLIPTCEQIMPTLRKIYGHFVRTNLK